MLQVVQEANKKYRESWQSKPQPTDDDESVKDPTDSSVKNDLCKCSAIWNSAAVPSCNFKAADCISLEVTHFVMLCSTNS